MKQLITFIVILICAYSCKKNDSTPTPIPTPSIQKVTKLTFQTMNSSGLPTEIQAHNQGTRLIILNVRTNGIYTCEFHGRNGRSIVQGSPRYDVALSNVAEWPIGQGDTFVIKKSGAEYAKYVTDQSDGNNSSILIEHQMGKTADQIKTDINSFTSISSLNSLKFTPL